MRGRRLLVAVCACTLAFAFSNSARVYMVGGSTYHVSAGPAGAAALSSEDSVLLKWEAPSRSGGSGIEGWD